MRSHCAYGLVVLPTLEGMLCAGNNNRSMVLLLPTGIPSVFSIPELWRQTYMPDARKRPFLFESTRSHASECLNSITQLSVSVCSWLVAGSTWHEIVIGAQSFPKCGRQGKDWRKDQVFVVNVLDGKRIPCINDLPTYNALNKAKLLQKYRIWLFQQSESLKKLLDLAYIQADIFLIKLLFINSFCDKHNTKNSHWLVRFKH